MGIRGDTRCESFKYGGGFRNYFIHKRKDGNIFSENIWIWPRVGKFKSFRRIWERVNQSQ